MNLIEVIGWIGGTAFMLCGIPLVIGTLKSGTSKHYSISFLVLWVVGEVFTLTYSLLIGKYPLIANYLVNALCLTVVIYFWFFPRKKKNSSQQLLKIAKENEK